MNKRRIDRTDYEAIAQRRLNVEKRQKEIVEAVKAKDENAVSRLQLGRIRSLDCRRMAVLSVTSNTGGRTPGVDGETWMEESEKIQAIEWDKTRRTHNPYDPKPGYIKRP